MGFNVFLFASVFNTPPFRARLQGDLSNATLFVKKLLKMAFYCASYA